MKNQTKSIAENWKMNLIEKMGLEKCKAIVHGAPELTTNYKDGKYYEEWFPGKWTVFDGKHWQQWLAAHSGAQTKPPAMGAPKKGYEVLEDAPGSYVKQR